MTDAGLLVSLEGISGTGKTYFANLLRAALDARTTAFVDELSDRKGAGIDRKIIAALHHTGDRFCRLGMPLTETFLLLALKMADYESYILDALTLGQTVIEDRSIDTVAVYQAVLLSPENAAGQLDVSRRIYAIGAQWRRPPDLTFLLEDEFSTCLARAEQRPQPRFSDDERRLLHDAADLYARYASSYGGRIVRLDRRKMTEHEIVAGIRTEIEHRKKRS